MTFTKLGRYCWESSRNAGTSEDFSVRAVPLRLIGDEDAAKQSEVESCIQPQQLPLLCPAVQQIALPRLPDVEHVAHLEHSEYDKLEECGRRHCVEKRVHHHPCSSPSFDFMSDHI